MSVRVCVCSVCVSVCVCVCARVRACVCVSVASRISETTQAIAIRHILYVNLGLNELIPAPLPPRPTPIPTHHYLVHGKGRGWGWGGGGGSYFVACRRCLRFALLSSMDMNFTHTAERLWQLMLARPIALSLSLSVMTAPTGRVSAQCCCCWPYVRYIGLQLPVSQ